MAQVTEHGAERAREGSPAERIFAVGDIHGCLDKLVALLARLPFDRARDTIVFLGDYIDRGPDSRGVLDHLLALKRTAPHAVFLMGNHEHQLLEYARTGEVEILRTMRSEGVEATLAGYGASIRDLRDLTFLPPEHREFLESLEREYCAGGYRFAHADVVRGPDDRRGEEQRYYSRGLARGCDLAEGLPVVFGHSAFETPLVTPDRIGIDTGAVYGNVLTALELPALVFHHA